MPQEHSITNVARPSSRHSQVEARDRHLALGDLDLLPRPGERVGALAADLDRRVGGRALADDAGRQHAARAASRPRLDLALGVAGGRREAQPRDRLVALGQRHQEALHARGAPDEDQQQPGGERVQRARVADLDALAEPPPHLRDDVVRRHPGGLVDEQTTPSAERQKLLVRRAGRAGTSRARGTRARWRSRPRGGARRRRPRARSRETSMRSSVARSETLRVRAPPSWSRTRPATAVPSTERRWSTTPSE